MCTHLKYTVRKFFTYVQTHKTIIKIRIINLSINLKISSHPFVIPPIITTDLFSGTLDEFAFSRILCKLNHTVCTVFLSDFIYSFHNFKINSCVNQ